MSYEFETPSISSSTNSIQVVSSAQISANTVTYMPYISPIIPADTILSPVNSNIIYTGVQVTPPIVNTIPYSILGASNQVTPNIYNLGATSTPYSVFQVISSVNNQSIPVPGYTTPSRGSQEHYIAAGYSTSPSTTPCGRDNKAGWYEIHAKQVAMIAKRRPSVLLCGDSIVAGLARYSTVWNKHFRSLNTVNCGIGGDRTQHVLWRIENMNVPETVRFVVLHCGTNNIDRDSPQDIANGVVSCGLVLQQKSPGLTIIATGLLPRDLGNNIRRTNIAETNKFLKKSCKQYSNFVYMRQDKDWILDNGLLNTQFYYDDLLHLVESGNEKFANSIREIISKLSRNESIICSSDSEVENSTSSMTSEIKIDEIDDKLVDDKAILAVELDETPAKTKKKRKRTSSPDLEKVARKKNKLEKLERRKNLTNNTYIDKTTSECSSQMKETKRDLDKPVLVKQLGSLKEFCNDECNHINVTSELLSGTAKSIDISLAENERKEARISKFEEGKLPNQSKKQLVSRSIKTCAPSALVEKIKKSMLQARKELSKKKLEIGSSSSLLTNIRGKGLSETKTSSTMISKLLSDYGSGSDTE